MFKNWTMGKKKGYSYPSYSQQKKKNFFFSKWAFRIGLGILVSLAIQRLIPWQIIRQDTANQLSAEALNASNYFKNLSENLKEWGK